MEDKRASAAFMRIRGEMYMYSCEAMKEQSLNDTKRLEHDPIGATVRRGSVELVELASGRVTMLRTAKVPRTSPQCFAVFIVSSPRDFCI